MPSLRLHAPVDVSDSPSFLREAPDPGARFEAAVDDVIKQIITSGLMQAPPETPITFVLLGVDHVFGALVDSDDSGPRDDLSWVPTFVESVKQGRDEVIREVLYFSPVVVHGQHQVVLNGYNALGQAVSGSITYLHPVIPVPAFLGHGHMPKREQAPEVVDFCLSVGRYLWGPHWDFIVAEEDRC